jgi:MurNAc alpha-1-phosphate uridylyltransferase
MNATSMKAMILAAGKGERMRPLTDHRPKPLLKVNGKPLIQYTVERLQRAGFRDLVVNVSHLGEQIEHFLGNGAAFGVHIEYSRETIPLETGGGIFKALPLLTQHGEHPFALVNADVWCDYDFAQLCKPLANNALAHLVLVNNPDHNPQGDFLLREGIIEKRAEGQTGLTYSGYSILHPHLFRSHDAAIEKFPLRDVLLPAIAQHRVSGELHTGTWVDVGTPERLAGLQTMST